MKEDTKGHGQDDAAKAKRKAGKKANHPGLQGDEKIGGKLKANTGNTG